MTISPAVQYKFSYKSDSLQIILCCIRHGSTVNGVDAGNLAMHDLALIFIPPGHTDDVSKTLATL